MRWTDRTITDFHDTDINKYVKPSALIRYFQSACDHQMNAQHPSSDELLAENKAFFLSRMAVKFHGRLEKAEEIEVDTWAAPSRGYTFMRCGEIRKDGRIIMQVDTAWSLVDIRNRKPIKTEDVTVNYGMDDYVECGAPLRFALPRDATFEKTDTRIIRYSDADFNGHMNNTKYPDILCDNCPEIPGKEVSEICISFLSEAPMGTSFDIYRYKAEDGYYFKTVKEDGSAGINARITLK